MSNLNFEMLKKGIGSEKKVYEKLREYNEKVIKAMETELDGLKAEYEDLKVNGNVITAFNMDEYLAKQKRVKELPSIISDLEQSKLKAYNDREQLQKDLCINAYKEIGKQYQSECNENLAILKSELSELAERYNELGYRMVDMVTQYNKGMYTVINTKGVYMHMDYHFKKIEGF